MASATRPERVPSACRGVIPALVVHGGARALEFYAEVFQATERMRVPGLWEMIDHAEIEIGGSVLIVEDESPYKGTMAPTPRGLDGFPFFLCVYVEDVAEVVELAVKRGATLWRWPQDEFYGGRDAFIVDPFGHGWMIATHVEGVAPDEMMRRMAGSAPGDRGSSLTRKAGAPGNASRGDGGAIRLKTRKRTVHKPWGIASRKERTALPTEDEKRTARRALEDRILNGEGRASPDQRARAFSNAGPPEPLHALLGKVAARPAQVTEADFAAAKASGFSEEQIFELVICAAVGQSTRLYDAGLAALAEAIVNGEGG